MFRRHGRRRTNILFVIFRLILSLTIFATLLAGLYSASKHFSGVDPLKLDPKTAGASILGLLSKLNLPKDLQVKISEKIPATKQAVHQDSPKAAVSGVNEMIFKFALIADSHSDNIFLKKALDQIKKDYPDIQFIIGLGDYTEVGTLNELKNVKAQLDSTGLRYFVAPGDHDLWDSRNKSLTPLANFNQIFGPSYQSFSFGNFKFIILFNSDNYLGLGESQKSWLSEQLARKDSAGIFVFLHEPLFHPSSDHFMGRVQDNLKNEAADLTRQLASAGVKRVFAGDTHYFTEYKDPQIGIQMVTIGAITSARNLQNPRFSIVSVYEDGNSGVEDVEVK